MRVRRRASGAPGRSSSSTGRTVAALLATLALAAVPLPCVYAATAPRAVRQAAAARTGYAYPGGAGLRWGHASVIADETLYVFGGKQGAGNLMSDYAAGCMSLDLSSKFTTDEMVWVSDCAAKAPQLAGHTAVINPDLNMVMLFGGAVPDDGPAAASPLHLFSAEIKFWNTPGDMDFPLALGNHSAVIDMATGDMIVHGGVLRGSSALTDVVSNTTLHMVTVPDEHLALNSAPTALMVVVLPPPAPAPTPASTRAAPGSTLTVTTTAAQSSTVTTTVKNTAPTRTSTVTRTAASTTKRPASTAEPRPTSTSGGRPRPPISLGLLDRRDASDAVPNALMSWTNATQPYGVAGRVGHTATMLGGGLMVVIGGFSEGGLVDMQTLFVYDAKAQSWRKRTARGQVPPPRRSHAATLINATAIAIHGGANADFSQALGDVAVLNTNTWTWQRPAIANAPAARYAHAAVQAGPYMLLTFGYVPSTTQAPAAGDRGMLILDTASWQFVTAFDPGRARLSTLLMNQKLSGGTIFGLFAASLVGLLVVLIMAYVGCTHYYSRHPLSDDDENVAMLPPAGLRSFGRRLTVRLGVRRPPLAVARPAAARPTAARPQTRFLANRTSTNLSLARAPRLSLTPTNDSLSPKPRDSRIMSPDMSTIDEKPRTPADGARYGRRTYLDEVKLPAGLRNRDSAYVADASGAAPPDGATVPRLATGLSRPATAASQAHTLDAALASIPALRASRVSTLQLALAQRDSMHSIGMQLDSPFDLADAVAPPRPWTTSSRGSGMSHTDDSQRESVDIITLLAHNNRFFVANPDDE
ncbi:hypothetical protein H4R21_003346 [Coemansia helicoidea]|uniref:Uncharacterized protein n=2 Tax=Coemansia TaxID=4863 RepID=A0ACC1L3P6_9FUNG|nr:hypothetical protein H4R21_003346 [Coemansia helicoidea]